MAQSFGLRSNQRMTIYDVMEAQGKFASNPANAQSINADTGEVLYQGPVEYPKMLYHPEGEKRMVEAERMEPSALGPQRIPAKYELIYQIVENAEDDARLRAAGWHEHPSDAIAASGEAAPPTTHFSTTDAIKKELERLQKQLDLASARSAKDASHPERTSKKMGI